MLEKQFAPGMRIVVRDAEWVIRQVDYSTDGGRLITCEGISELVRGKEGQFLTQLERDIQVLDPADTKLVEDESGGYAASKLYVESMLRQQVPTDQRIHLGHKAAMDPLPFQLDPTYMALSQARQRILIADAVGLGKTLEAGILMSELIRRGRGKRILVLAVKSMLTQFQKEMWSRFSIPLTRLDSSGLQSVRNRIPANHNPFLYYDKSIISIDTLKQDVEYRHYIENAHWDIIVIDEAHNVAERGTRSQRSRLAKLLAGQSDTMIMLSATPHDGKPESFASLMNMLDATAIANPSDYTYDDFKDKNLVVRRFKKDVKDQISGEFPERHIDTVRSKASMQEEEVYRRLVELELAEEEGKRSGTRLFKVGLEKALFSSPMACLSTVENRLKKLEKQSGVDALQDINELSHLSAALRNVDKASFSKYQSLLKTIKSDFKWKKSASDDRLVIFTESIPTLEFLFEHLKADLKLNDAQIAQLHGGMADIELMETVEEFGKGSSKLRLLVCSDVASEGINLHHQSHKMIHFDIPWSLMVFQQRNGRIDRYGQQHQPQIRYLLADSDNDQIRGDMRVLEVLIEKDEQAVTNIGDSSEFTGKHDQQAEEEQVGDFMLSGGLDAADELDALFNQTLEDDEIDSFFSGADDALADTAQTAEPISLYDNELEYFHAGLSHLKSSDNQLHFERVGDKQLELYAPADLRHRFKFLPPEIRPNEANKHTLAFSHDVNVINQEIIRCRAEQSAWPQVQYLWPVNPVVQWLGDKLQGSFGRHQAPVIRVPNQLDADVDHFILSGLFPNRRSHAVVNPWLVVSIEREEVTNIQGFDEFIKAQPFHNWQMPNAGGIRNADRQQQLLPIAIAAAEPWLANARQSKQDELDAKLVEQLDRLEQLKGKQVQQLELQFERSKQSETLIKNKKQQRTDEINRVFNEYHQWITDTADTEKTPYIQVIAVLTGAEG